MASSKENKCKICNIWLIGDNMDKINKKMLILFGVLILIIGFILHFSNRKSKEKIQIVNDNSTFYTVASCASKYISYLSANDTDNLLILLDNKYKKNNSIDAGSIYNYVGILSGNYMFKAKKMYFEKVGKARYKYYVYGVVIENTMDVFDTNEKEYYLIVYLNEKDMTFSIEPYDGEIFNN